MQIKYSKIAFFNSEWWLNFPKEIRMEEKAFSEGHPKPHKTWDGSTNAAVQADPLDTIKTLLELTKNSPSKPSKPILVTL